MARTHRRGARPAPAPPWRGGPEREFRCGRCKAMVGPPPSGGHNRNHCPLCLYSRHVDLATPGDRASDCGGLMEPAGVFERPKGEEVIVHRCLGCGFERWCRIAADDNDEVLGALPRIEPRHNPRPRRVVT